MSSEYHRFVPSRWDRITAPAMFALSTLYLISLAGLIHRASEANRYDIELRVMMGTALVIWPIIVGEAVFSTLRKDPSLSARTAWLRVALVFFIPPMRIAWIHPVHQRIWMPRLGWHPPGKPLLKGLDRLTNVPMLFIALLILPVLIVEMYQPEQLQLIPGLTLALNIGTAVIWFAFAFEFIIKVSASPSTLGYMKERWLDLAIVGLPTLEYLLTHWVDAAPLARLLRLGRAIGPQQIGKLSKAYKLRGVMMKGWQSFLLLEGVTRLITGHNPAKQLQKLEEKIADLEEELTQLRAEAEELRKSVAEQNSQTSQNSLP